MDYLPRSLAQRTVRAHTLCDDLVLVQSEASLSQPAPAVEGAETLLLKQTMPEGKAARGRRWPQSLGRQNDRALLQRQDLGAVLKN